MDISSREKHRSILYVDMDDVLCDFSSAYQNARKMHPEITFPQSQYGFFQALKPIDGGLAFMQMVLTDLRFDVYILTAPSKRNPLSYTEKRVWVEQHLGYEFVKRLIICPNKGLLRGDYLIDDNNEGQGQENFEGKLIHFGSRDAPDWLAVARYLNVKLA